MNSTQTPIYLDNAATTPIDPEVWKEMQPYFEQFTANPSSIHSHGRQAKVILDSILSSMSDESILQQAKKKLEELSK